MATEQPRPNRPDIAAQRAETGAAGTVGPDLSAIPEPMTRGLVRGSIVGGVIGAVALAPLALIDIGDLAVLVRLVIVMIIGAVAGSTVGAVFFGGAVAELEDDDSAGDASVVPDAMRRTGDAMRRTGAGRPKQ